MGSGWFVGAILLTAWMRLLSAVHVPFTVTWIGAPIAVIAIVLAWRGRMLTAPPWNRIFATVLGRHLSGWQRAVWLLLTGVARPTIRAAAQRDRVAALVPLGRVVAVGLEGAGLVRTPDHGPVRHHVGMALPQQPQRLLRRRAALSKHGAAIAGMAGDPAGTLGRLADQPAVVADRCRVCLCDLRLPGAQRIFTLGRAGRDLARGLAAVLRGSYRARRLRGPRDGDLFHARGIVVAASRSHAHVAGLRGRGVFPRCMRDDQESPARSGSPRSYRVW